MLGKYNAIIEKWYSHGYYPESYTAEISHNGESMHW